MAEEEFDYLLKIVIIGDSGVGKTNLLCRFTKNSFNMESRSTIGVDFSPKTMRIGDTVIKAQFWDTAGQEKSLTNAYYKNSTGAILVYDITKKESFNNIKTWLRDVKEYADPDLTAIIIEDDRAVTIDIAHEFASQEGLFFMEVSALQNAQEWVHEAFNLLIQEIVKKKDKEMKMQVKLAPTGKKMNTSDGGKSNNKKSC